MQKCMEHQVYQKIPEPFPEKNPSISKRLHNEAPRLKAEAIRPSKHLRGLNSGRRPWGLHKATKDEPKQSPPLEAAAAPMASFSAGNAFIKPRSIRRTPSSGGVLGHRLIILSCDRRDAYGSLAARLLGPPTKFEASKLKVIFMEEGTEKQTLCSIPRAYTLTHCDFTANLTLAVSNSISTDALMEWQTTLQRDDVVAEWKMIKEEMSLLVHCYVSGANLLQNLAAGFRYHIFSKELPLVLKAVVHGDFAFFSKHPELMEAKVWIYFHSKSKKYNRVECWGPLKDATQRTYNDPDNSIQNMFVHSIGKWGSLKAILHVLVALLL